MRKKSHAFSDAIGQKPTLIIYTLGLPLLPGQEKSRKYGIFTGTW